MIGSFTSRMPTFRSRSWPKKACDAPVLAERIAAGFSIVFAGNLGVAQSLETVLDAAERLQAAGMPVRFFLVGSGSRSDWLQDQLRQRKLSNVEVPGDSRRKAWD